MKKRIYVSIVLIYVILLVLYVIYYYLIGKISKQRQYTFLSKYSNLKIFQFSANRIPYRIP